MVHVTPIVNRKFEFVLEEGELLWFEKFHVEEDGGQLAAISIDFRSNLENAMLPKQPRSSLAPHECLVLSSQNHSC